MAYLPRWIARGLPFEAPAPFTVEQEARVREIVREETRTEVFISSEFAGAPKSDGETDE